jgi:outer membrane lipoprotein-sorting protein
MRVLLTILFGIGLSGLATAQTADELVAKNLHAKGGIEKIKAIQSLRMTGKMQQGGGFTAEVSSTALAPNLLREAYTIQGMTGIQAYDGSTGWQISPFGGRKEPELMGEDDLRGLVEEADFYGPLVDYQKKDNRIEYLGHDTVDGDDAYRLKVTLANGDILYYYLDPETYLEIRVETVHFIRGSVRESFRNLGSYKLVAGVYFPFSLEAGSKENPESAAKITFDKMEANVTVNPREFKMPAAPAGAGGKEF